MDNISAEYGWCDDTILDLTIRRLLQIRDVIRIRQSISMRSRQVELEWQTKQLATYMIASSQLPQKARKQLAGGIEKMSMQADEEIEVAPLEMSEDELDFLMKNGDTSAAEKNAKKGVNEFSFNFGGR